MPGPRRLTSSAVVLALLGAWFVLLAPTTLGGATTYIRVDGHSMDPTYATDDLIVLRRQPSYDVGEVVAFAVDGGKVIHRVVGGDGVTGYVTQGDNNPDVDLWRPTDEQVLGSARVRVPGAAAHLTTLNDPALVGGGVGLVAGMSMLGGSLPRGRRRRAELLAARQAEGAPARSRRGGRPPSLPLLATCAGLGAVFLLGAGLAAARARLALGAATVDLSGVGGPVVVALALLGVVLVAIAGVSALRLRKDGSLPLALVLARYGSRVVTVDRIAPPASPRQAVRSVKDLDRVARAEGGTVLHEDAGDGTHRFVLDGLTTSFEHVLEVHPRR